MSDLPHRGAKSQGHSSYNGERTEPQKAMILHSSLLLQAVWKFKSITTLVGSRYNLSVCLHRV